jgi:hypothetical protein
MPKAVIDFDLLKKLVQIQCTVMEVCSVLDIGDDALYRVLREHGYNSWVEYRDKYAPAGRASLRRRQWQKAVDEGDTAMLKFLGKHYLDQHDKLNVGFNGDAPAVFTLRMGKNLKTRVEGDDNEEDNEKEDD